MEGFVEFTQDIPERDQEYLEEDTVGPCLHKGSVFKFIKLNGDKVLCEGGSGQFYVPKDKVKIF